MFLGRQQWRTPDYDTGSVGFIKGEENRDQLSHYDLKEGLFRRIIYVG
jgi:hypothetical protein